MANTTIPSELIQASVALGGSPTTTTQSASDNTTKIATTAYVTAAVNSLIDSAPGTMNTLNEIAAALNDDAAFNTTVTNAIATKLPLGGGTMTGNIALGDNNKAIFGAGSDLQIYHDGSNSYIREFGAGDLKIQGINVQIENSSGIKMFRGVTSGEAILYYNNSPKLATTSTGIDVTGTATMDGLTVDGTSDLNGTLTVGPTYTTDITGNDVSFFRANGASYIRQRGGQALVLTTNDGSDRQRIKIDANGDISFYEDTGSTAKLFWDASAESLGIGTTSPAEMLNIEVDSGSPAALIKANGQGGSTSVTCSLILSNGSLSSNASAPAIYSYRTADYATTAARSSGLKFQTTNANAAVTAMTIDNSGNVGIGTDVAESKLDIHMSDSNGVYGRGRDGNLNLENTNTSVTEGGWLSISGYMGNTSNSGQYSMGAITGGKQTTAADGDYGGYLSLWTTSGGGNGEANSGMYERVRVDGSGNMLVGTTSNASGQRLHLESAGQFGQLGLRHSSATSGKFWYVGPASNNTFAIYNQTPAGVYLGDGATSWTGASDESLKENIVELTGALDKVKNFRCVEYNFISDETSSKKIGFIAQDWQEDYSQVVSQDPDGNLGIQYTETIPVLLKAIQEQQTLIESLTARIETLEG